MPFVYGMLPVDKPLGVTYRLTCQEWLSQGMALSLIFPIICTHRCTVASVSFHLLNSMSGHRLVRINFLLLYQIVVKIYLRQLFYCLTVFEKNSSTLLLNASLCSIKVAWPELGTIHNTAPGMFCAIAVVCCTGIRS